MSIFRVKNRSLTLARLIAVIPSAGTHLTKMYLGRRDTVFPVYK